ncbi:hypothetical protein, partial [Gracilimonas sp.]|uniref:hypothetical protein n=1 Tax=Gracilimonas sp. TaxID=1974203 RepID=UPI002870ED4F|nr:hypothetical protein [Gracilimonas sp.]
PIPKNSRHCEEPTGYNPRLVALRRGNLLDEDLFLNNDSVVTAFPPSNRLPQAVFAIAQVSLRNDDVVVYFLIPPPNP